MLSQIHASHDHFRTKIKEETTTDHTLLCRVSDHTCTAHRVDQTDLRSTV